MGLFWTCYLDKRSAAEVVDLTRCLFMQDVFLMFSRGLLVSRLLLCVAW